MNGERYFKNTQKFYSMDLGLRKSFGMHLDYYGRISNQDDVCLMEDLPMVLLANLSVLWHALSLAESL